MTDYSIFPHGSLQWPEHGIHLILYMCPEHSHCGKVSFLYSTCTVTAACRLSTHTVCTYSTIAFRSHKVQRVSTYLYFIVSLCSCGHFERGQII